MAEGRRLDPTILREYDIRGTVPDTLCADDVRIIGRAFASILLERGGKTVAVGYDGRLSSPELEAALVEGLSSTGADVTRIGLGPTPMLYFAHETLPTDAGLMITGSHNPPDYNGIKMVIDGKPFFAGDIQLLGKRVADGNFAEGQGDITEKSVMDDYVARLLEAYEKGKTPLKIAWDAGNGAAGEALTKLTDGLPGDHILLNEIIDGTFPAHHPDPTVEKNLDQLKEAVAREGCDLGIAFDGDGDRIGVIDGQGRVLWGDQLLAILARNVLEDHPKSTKIIVDVKTSVATTDEIENLGGEPVMWKTGHSNIKIKMVEEDAPLAGEMSAHIFFKHQKHSYDDALYAAVRLLSVLNRSGESLAEIYDSLPVMMNTPELRFDCAEERKFAVVDEVRERLRGSGFTINEIDGVRVETDDGWWLLRASNTQAVLVARCESDTTEGLERLKRALGRQLQASGISLPETE